MNHRPAPADEPDRSSAFVGFSLSVERAWSRSFMASFPTHVVESLLAQARETRVEAGEIFYRGEHHGEMAMFGLVAEGRLRIYIQAETGRQVTMHYAVPGSVVGAPALLLAGAQHESEQARQQWLMLGGRKVQGEALQDTLLVRFSPSQFLRLMRTEVSVAWPLTLYLARHSLRAQQMLADDVFLSVRSRVARHLIDLAVSNDGMLTVSAGHQDIADAIGSVREVVSRALGKLRDEGLIARRGNETVLLDIAQLHAVAAEDRDSPAGP